MTDYNENLYTGDLDLKPVEPNEALDYVEPQEDISNARSMPTGLSQRTPQEAADLARKMCRNRVFVGVGMCLRTVHNYYGVGNLYPSAEKGWYGARYKHHSSPNSVPANVAVWWTNGRYGHVAISIGNGLCLSTDWKERGKIDVARISDIGPRWGQTFQGWTEDINGVRYWKPAPKPVVHLSNLRYGKANKDVLKLKRHLKSKGYFSGLMIPFFGPGTKIGYKRWQEHLGYKGRDADGIPGRASLEKLGFEVRA